MAVGKSTTARVLKALLARWPDHPRVDLITTDGFLLPNADLERRGLMDAQGLPRELRHDPAPELPRRCEVGREPSEAPVYSHFHYDILPGQTIVVERPDILIVEGLNVLQPARLPKGGEVIPFVSDFFDFSIYIDAEPEVIQEWYVTRFMRLREHGLPRPRRLLPPLRQPVAGRGAGSRDRHLAHDQPEKPGGEHPADAPARAPHPAQGTRPPRRDGRAAQALISASTIKKGRLGWAARKSQ